MTPSVSTRRPRTEFGTPVKSPRSRFGSCCSAETTIGQGPFGRPFRPRQHSRCKQALGPAASRAPLIAPGPILLFRTASLRSRRAAARKSTAEAISRFGNAGAKRPRRVLLKGRKPPSISPAWRSRKKAFFRSAVSPASTQRRVFANRNRFKRKFGSS